ncbi:MAG: hypothetical protein GX647_05005 [Clostridiales bacterium]|nr:hypothetical protein [Clostridiales bacterium]
MATHKIWKLKFNISKAGLAFRWGDGEIQRFPFGLKSGEGVDVAEGMDEENAVYPDDGADDEYGRYDDGYAGEDSYADGEGDYEEGDYEEGDYDQSEYGEEDYQEGYYDENGEYIEGEEEQSSFMQYIDQNDWVTYALLVLFPPLGIYLLWRRGQFDTMIRAGVSAVSAIWFIAILWIIIALLTGGANDDPTGTKPGMVLHTVTPTPIVSTAPSVAPTSTFNAAGTVNPLESAAATPLPGTTIGPSETAGAGYVYSPATGIYYHAVKDCAYIPTGVSASYVTVKFAENRGQSPCPLCFNATTYYATTDGRYYHVKSDCSGMKNASPVTEQAAKLAGKTACPVCIGGTGGQTPNTPNTQALQEYINRLSKDASGIKVWATKGGNYFHTVSDCSNMKGASNVTLLTALKAGKTACPRCASAAGKIVYATETGKYYHKDSTCSGMRGAKALPVAAAMVMGKDSCPVCIGKVKLPSNLTGGGTTAPETSEDGVYVYATSNGRYYHTDSGCQGMTGADRVLLKTMLAAGRPACPVCAKDAGRQVYATKDGKYYHSYATCSGMSGATAGSLAQALAYGYEKCPVCWKNVSGGDTVPGETESVSGVSVYRTDKGKYYHTNQTCSGMSGATKVTLEAAVAEGKTACPVCASIANKTVYATAGGKYYHYNQTCSGMTNAKAGTLADALMHGFAACPVCVKTSTGGTQTPGDVGYAPGKSGIKVYASQSGKYYHLLESCAGSEASYITLETALNYGKDACPICAKKVAERTVYAAAGDQYFHATAEHAGSGAKAGTAASALAYGLKVCPVCRAAAESGDGSVPESSETFNRGESGIKVYATIGGTYFHISKQHAGSEASYVTLETALNYGKKPCPDCASAAYKTVYATMDSKYYHYSKTCAGSEAKSGYLAIALAMGKDPCPVCVKGSGGGSSGGGSGGSTTVDAVYIDLSGDSNPSLFHKSSSCSGAGMSGGDKVTVEFVQDQGFSPCPYCW